MANTWGALNAANSVPNFQVFAGQSQNAVGSVYYANDTTQFIAANSPIGANVGGVRISAIGVNNRQTGQIAQAAAVGVTAVGVANNTLLETSTKSVHTGWQLRTEFTGPLTVSFTAGWPGAGQGVNANGFIVLSGNSSLGTTGANIGFLYGNTATGAVGPATNVWFNGIVALVNTSMGAGYNVAPTSFTLSSGVPLSAPTSLQFGVGGRGGRVQYETLVTLRNIA